MPYRFDQPKASEITSREHFMSRRNWVKNMGLGMLAASFPGLANSREFCATTLALPTLNTITEKKAATHYNNYYEFSTDKEAIRILARALTLNPWEISIQGEVEKPVQLDLDAIANLCEEERIYRFRCVEGWSMVVPWVGVPLHRILSLAAPLSSAKFVRFTALERPKEMIGQRRPVLDWPYSEALRIDEAMHPLTFIATGMYGDSLPPQNGAPLRLVVPWKYGFKSIKAIQSIELLREQPITTWQKAAPKEYGFYANVNPEVSHPRWSQKREVPLGQTRKQSTLPFNGYQDLVASLYKNMDLSVHF